ncbi:hypothetical protein GCM10022255_018940 [Dactylosporangium darangshiense]|uniref:Uncharacterized protein n=1 Tax=Dactylosporangium darangshiense TaxID=579108 RepID=A0ABP8D3D2_9ACTN
MEGMAEAIAARHGVPAEKMQAGPAGGVDHVFPRLIGDETPTGAVAKRTCSRRDLT